MLNRSPGCVKNNRRTQLERKRSLVSQEIAHRGGVCEWPECGRNDRLSWHHTDPAAKLFSIGKDMRNKGQAAIASEMEKCKVLCHGHHHMAEACLDLGISAPWEGVDG